MNKNRNKCTPQRRKERKEQQTTIYYFTPPTPRQNKQGLKENLRDSYHKGTEKKFTNHKLQITCLRRNATGRQTINNIQITKKN
jgi:hypothetical protein